jgi:hypothetical protein
MMEVKGLDEYLNINAEILSRKIQSSFRPLYTAGEDEYCKKLGIFTDYAKFRGIDLYEAQKATIESVHRCMKEKNSAIVVGEMGTGK